MWMSILFLIVLFVLWYTNASRYGISMSPLSILFSQSRKRISTLAGASVTAQYEERDAREHQMVAILTGPGAQTH